MRYHTFQTDVRSPTTTFDSDHQSYGGTPGIPYHTPSSSPSIPYHGGPNPGSVPSSYSDGGSYTLSGSDDGNPYNADQYSSSGSAQNFCPCRTSPGTGVAYISLAQQLQSSLNSLRQYSHHPPNTSCLLYRRIVELNNIMQYVFVAFSLLSQAIAAHFTPVEMKPQTQDLRSKTTGPSVKY